MNIYHIIIPQTVKVGKEIGHGWVLSKEEGIFTDNSNGLTYIRKGIPKDLTNSTYLTSWNAAITSSLSLIWVKGLL